MKCEKESQVVHAVRSRAWSSSLLNHVGTCTACAETKLVAEALTSLAAIQLTENPAPPAAQVWSRAQFCERYAGRRRTEQYLSPAITAVAAAYVMSFMIWSASRVLPSFHNVVRSGFDETTDLVVWGAVVSLLLVVGSASILYMRVGRLSRR